jgi:hypothetical protein
LRASRLPSVAFGPTHRQLTFGQGNDEYKKLSNLRQNTQLFTISMEK